jgi:hypothetical protein
MKFKGLLFVFGNGQKTVECALGFWKFAWGPNSQKCYDSTNMQFVFCNGCFERSKFVLPRVSKFCLARGWPRCLKVTLQTHPPIKVSEYIFVCKKNKIIEETSVILLRSDLDLWPDKENALYVYIRIYFIIIFIHIFWNKFCIVYT